MKKWILLAPAATGAAVAAVILSRKSDKAAPKAAKPAKGGKKPVNVIKTPKTGIYSFASGFKDAKTVNVSLTYDAETCFFNGESEEFISPSGDSHVAILEAPELSIQVEYAAYYAGDDFAATAKDIKERFNKFAEVSYGGINGVSYFNGKNYCLAFPVEGVSADYVLITVVNMGDDTEEEAEKLPENEYVVAILNSLTITAE